MNKSKNIALIIAVILTLALSMLLSTVVYAANAEKQTKDRAYPSGTMKINVYKSNNTLIASKTLQGSWKNYNQATDTFWTTINQAPQVINTSLLSGGSGTMSVGSSYTTKNNLSRSSHDYIGTDVSNSSNSPTYLQPAITVPIPIGYKYQKVVIDKPSTPNCALYTGVPITFDKGIETNKNCVIQLYMNYANLGLKTSSKYKISGCSVSLYFMPETYNYEVRKGGENATAAGTYTVESEEVTILPGTREGYTPSPSSWTIPKGSVGNKTFTPEWAPNKYAVKLDDQSATVAGTENIQATFNEIMPEIKTPQKTGHIFAGYYEKPNGEGTKYYKEDGTSTKKWNQASTATLYAYWKAKTGFIEYNGNGNTSGVTEKSKFTYGEFNKLNANNFKKDGYTFVCWNTKADGTGEDYMPQTAYDSLKTLFPSANGTMYAKWGKQGESNDQSSTNSKTKLVKKNNTLTIKTKNISLKKKKIKKKNKTYKISKAIKVSKAKGTITYKKISGNKKIIINNKTKKITIGKGLKKGKYAVKVKVTAAGNKTFKTVNKMVSFKIKIK